MPSQLLYIHLAWFMCGLIIASSSIFSDTEDLDTPDALGSIDDLNFSPFLYDDYQDIASVPNDSQLLPNDDLFSADMLTSCLENENVAQPGKLRTRGSCPAPEIPINVPQLPNLLPSIQEPNVLSPSLLDQQSDLAATRSAELFCSSSKYRLDVTLGRAPIPVCGPSLPLQQGWVGSGVQGYYVNVEYSRLISVLAPLCPTEDVFCCQFWRPYRQQKPEWNAPVDLGVGLLCFHLIELGWTGYNEVDTPDPP